MLANLKPYPEMKDSGVEWLGEVPAHWDVRRLRNVAEVRFSNVDKHSKDDEYAIRLCNYSDVYYNERIRSDIEFMRATATAEEIERFLLVPGDVLITKDSESWEDIGVPALVENTDDALVCGYHLALLRPITERIAGRFLHRALSCRPVANQFFVRANGVTRFGLSQTAIKAVWLPIAPLSEQAAIVRFLDHVDRRIQRYLRAREKLAALLEEQKQAIVHEAVTGRIDVRTGKPYPAYKPSGVEWLGDIPKHWEVAALRHRYFQCLGKMLDSKRITGNHSLPYLRNVDVQWDHINIEDLPTMDIPPDEYDRYTVQQGDLLVCEGGEVGRGALWSGGLARCGFQKALHRLRPRNPGRDLPRFVFVYYVLRTAVGGNAFRDGQMSTIAHLTGDKLRAHRFPFPPMTEQESLVSLLDAVSKQADSAISHTRREIELMGSYRNRLIADVVTGKIDVREAATVLPEEAGLSGNARAEVEVDAGIRKEALEMTDWDTCPAVERNPRKISGAWAFTGTRVPVYALFENLESGATVKQFLEWFPDVKEWQVAAVLHHEAEHLKTTAQV